jgi:NADH:ubiquinone oxidoreductase subunit 2 (subunit N)
MLMYFEEPEEGHQTRIGLPKDMMAAITLNGMAALVLGVLPSSVIDLCRISVG